MPRRRNIDANRLTTEVCGECGNIKHTDAFKLRSVKGGNATVLKSQQPGELSMRERGKLGGRPRKFARAGVDAGLPSPNDGGEEWKPAGAGVHVSILPNEPHEVVPPPASRGTSSSSSASPGFPSPSRRGRL